jgi:hypothetical protein
MEDKKKRILDGDDGIARKKVASLPASRSEIILFDQDDGDSSGPEFFEDVENTTSGG